MQVWLSDAVEKILEMKWYTWVIVAALIIMGVALIKTERKARWNSRRVAAAAMCVAIAFVLSCVRIIKFPQGGSVTACSMLPIIAFAVAVGPAKGLLAGVAYGLLQLIQDPYVIHPLQLLMDYPMAFGALALGGLVNFVPVKDSLKLPLAVLLGSLGRFVMALISGAVFFASIYAEAGQSAFNYSFIYNIGYLGWDALFCLVISFVPGIRRIIPILRDGSYR